MAKNISADIYQRLSGTLLGLFKRPIINFSNNVKSGGTKDTPESLTLDEKRRYERGCGYCRNPDCEKFNRDTFLMGTISPVFICPTCKQTGMAIKEVASVKCAKDIVFSEVRVEYDYRPSLEPWIHKGEYRALAIVRDESVGANGNVYYVRTPLIRTEKRALAVAEGLLGNLSQYPLEVIEDQIGSRPRETIIDFDLPKTEVKAKLAALGNRLGNSGLRNNNE